MDVKNTDNNTSAPSAAGKNQDYGGLSNEQLRFIFHRFQDYLQSLDAHLDAGRVPFVHEPIPGMKVPAIGPICKEHIQEVKSSSFYLTLTSVVKDLTPVVSVIESVNAMCDPGTVTPPQSCAVRED